MSAWLIGYLAGVLTVPVVVVWLGWAVWRNPNSGVGIL